jgi:hypothetical protein
MVPGETNNAGTQSPAGQPDATVKPDASATAPTDPALIERANRVVATLKAAMDATNQQIGQIQAAYMANPAMLQSSSIGTQMETVYQSAFNQYEAARPEAKALADAGLVSVLNALNALEEDVKKAFGIAQAMVAQQLASTAAQAGIMADAASYATQTVVGVNQRMASAFEAANQKFDAYLKS